MAVTALIGSLILSLYECPNEPQLRCISARVNHSRLSEEEVAQVRPLVIATQAHNVVMNCSNTANPESLRDALIIYETNDLGEIQSVVTNSPNCLSGTPFIGLGIFSLVSWDFVLMPNELIMDPAPNTTFCSSGARPDVYIYSSNELHWAVSSEIKIGHGTSIDRFEMKIDTGRTDSFIFEGKYNELIEAIINEGFEVIDSRDAVSGRFITTVTNCHGRNRMNLPLITFTIYNAIDDTPVFELHVDPDDYLTADCRLTINASPDGALSGTFGENILRNLAIHFRISTQIMGFCDPI